MYHLNIVSFTITYPANYGGIIDVYHKLVALKSCGVKIHLHCFEYDRSPAHELNAICESVHYYKRKTGLREQLSLKPYIVRSRRSDILLTNLLSNDYPILFEGLHSCFYIHHPALKNRNRIYRESNIEHHYYFNLFRSEKRLIPRLFFLVESIKLRLFQSVLKLANTMLVVSTKDTEYLLSRFPGNSIHYIPSFHGNNRCKSITGKGKYVLYHGNLSVAENSRAAEFLIKEVFNDIEVPLVIAGLKPSYRLKKLASDHGVQLIEDPAEELMEQLIREAHLNILVTFQETGLKLKLLNTLYLGRFVLVNKAMLAGTGLESLCSLAESPQDFQTAILSLFSKEFDESIIAERENILKHLYSDEENARKIINLIF